MTLVITTDILKFPSLQIIPNICNANWRSSSVVAISADYQQRKL